MPKRLPKNYAFSSELPPAAIAAFRKVDLASWDNAEPIFAAFAAVGYPDQSVAPRADSLTPAQRAVAELVTELDLNSRLNEIDQKMPRKRADRRRWLGLDPAGPLERMISFQLDGTKRTEPVWRAVRLLQEKDDDDDGTRVEKLVASLPIARRLELWGAVNLSWPEVWNLSEWVFFDYNSTPSLAGKLRAEGRSWAPAYADGWLAALAKGDIQNKEPPLLPFLALVRAKIPIEPRWDALLPIGSKHASECVKAIPKERRAAAVLSAMRNMHPGYALKAGVELLPLVPDPAIAQQVIDNIPKSIQGPREVFKRLTEAAGKHADVLAVIKAAQRKKPKPIQLTTTSLRAPRAGFSALDEKQLRAAGKLYFGKVWPLTTLLSKDRHCEESLLHLLEYRSLANAAGKHVYDAWEYAGDSGTIFAAGTTRVVAEVVQGSVECDDEALRDAVDDALRQKPKVAR